MQHIFYLMGKSAAGKDALYQSLLKNEELPLKKIVLYTTRPIRAGEEEGREYYFTDEEGFLRLKAEGKIIESRSYDTVHGIWTYFTADDGQIDLSKASYLGIGTLESYEKMLAYFGRKVMVPLYIEVEDGERLTRAIKREKEQDNPRYAELCRRFLSDSRDFSEENLERAGIGRRFYNGNLAECLSEIEKFIKTMLY